MLTKWNTTSTPSARARRNTVGAARLHAYLIAEAHEAGTRRSMFNHLDGTTLGNASRAHATVGVRNGTGANHSACAKTTGQRRMGDQLVETEVHGTTMRMAEPTTIAFNFQRQMHPTVMPGVA